MAVQGDKNCAPEDMGNHQEIMSACKHLLIFSMVS